MPDFVLLGRSFRAKGGLFANDYHARVIASKDAFYLVVYLSPAESGAMLAGGMGLIGGLMAAAGAALSDDRIKRGVVKLSELPAEVTNHPDWPLRGVRKDYPVAVIPRAEVKQIRYSWWRTFDIITPDQTFCVGPRTFGRGRVLKQMREWGWEF